MSLKTLRAQTWALVRKNLLIICVRSWLSTLIRGYLLPIAFITLIWHVPDFIPVDTKKYGYGYVAPIQSLADVIGDEKLVLMRDGNPASDIQRVLDTITEPLSGANVVHLNSTSNLNTQLDDECPVNEKGFSPCFGVVIFEDSPLSDGGNATWAYTIRADPKKFSMWFDTMHSTDPMDKLFLPLQTAVENAITNTTEPANLMKFSEVGTQEDADREARRNWQQIIGGTFLYFIFFSVATVAQHVSAMVAKDRETGMSHLIDSMSGGAAWARVMSYNIAFDIVYLPLWIILGCVHWALLLPKVSLAIVIFWSILSGFAVVSGAIFGAAFFTKTQVASIAVFLVSFLLAVVGAVQGDPGLEDKDLAGPIASSLLFPPAAWVLFFGYMLQAQILQTDINVTQALPTENGQFTAEGWTTQVPCIIFFIIAIIHIFGFGALAAVTENLLHGKRHRRADFDETSGDDHIAVQTTDLVKHYTSGWLYKMFCCCRPKPAVKAVQGLDFVSHKNQVLCLLGPNGSGKTTTLDMLAGTQKPTSGSIQIKALPTQLGVCPQKNVLWNNLTVYEHLVIWNQIKGGIEDKAAIDRLIEKCDLSRKRNDLAKTLSGGMKRKLQLACMLIGGSSVCLLDEVTSGLDPLSRRAIWNVILSERSHRTMILTTHFLDEAEVLADHIVILSLGDMKCQGSPAQLKSKFGGGYHVSLPKTVDVSQVPYSIVTKEDQYVCNVPDSKAAVQLLSSFQGLGNSQACVTGPTIEDVFLRVSDDASAITTNPLEEEPLPSSISDSPLLDRTPMSAAKAYWVQTRALFLKRLTILRSHWWIYCFALLMPIGLTASLSDTLSGWELPECGQKTFTEPEMYNLDYYVHSWSMVIGPTAANKSIIDTMERWDLFGDDFDASWFPAVVDSLDEMKDHVFENREFIYGGAIWSPEDGPATIMIPVDWNGVNRAMGVLSMANQARSGVNITGHVGRLRSYTDAEHGISLFYTIIFCLLQTLYPAFFAIYPTYERRTQVRALQYSNGIRPAPLLTAYLLFDFIFVIVIAAACAAIMNVQAAIWGGGYIFLVLALYGMAASMFVYFVSRVARSQPGAFTMSFLLAGLMYAISIICVLVVTLGGGSQSSVDGVGFGLGAIFPIQNVFRALEVAFNSNAIRCRDDGVVTDPGSIFAFGGPILLLIFQVIALFLLTLYSEGISLAWLTRKSKTTIRDGEQVALTGRIDVDKEKSRVVASEVDLLRLLNVSKQFGNNVAVDDVSFGLRSGEIMALLGPNGAGKTTTINMIRGDMAPDSGNIYLEGYDTYTHTRHAQEHLGVCPQFDALDLLTVREHLTFYARCKGVPSIPSQVDQVMSLVGITPHASKMASALSGGNKRKLSLAIALIGNPPVLILDEPSSAMDATSKRVLWKTLEAVAPGRSVLITTHSMEEADALSTRAAILAKRMLAIGTIKELREAYSNEYHVHLVLRSAPVSSKDEMDAVADWVQETFGDQVQFDGERLGGQIRFIVPIDSPVPASAGARFKDQNFVQYMIETLEENKHARGLDCYSINTATMERVFLSVMQNSDMDEDTSVEKRKWWQW